MKFTNGAWLYQKDVKAHFPAQADLVECAADSFTVFAATNRVKTRNDMHDFPMLTMHCSSPMNDVICIRVTHHAGAAGKKPGFEIFEHPAEKSIHDDGTLLSLTSGNLSAAINRSGPWQGIEFSAHGETLAACQEKGIAFVDWEGSGHYMRTQLTLGVGENIYGLGEHFTPFVKNGQVVDIWNADGGTCSEQAYKNVPFYLSSRGYGVFVNHPGHVSFEVGSENVSQVQFSVQDHEVEFYIIYGPGPKDVLEKYTALTGRPALPPAWSFGLWLSTSFTTSYDEKTVTEFIDGMQQRDLPLDVFHFDCFWMKEYHWCNFRWDERTFPDPQGMLERLKQRGLHICLWLNPYIAQASHLFNEGMQNGYLLKKANGEVWQGDLWQPGAGIVDFTNPDACKWFQDNLRPHLRMGADCFKSDFSERIPTDVVYWNGSDPQRMHNYYTYLYNKTVFEVIQQEHGEDAAVLFARSATTGGQRFPVHWGGDNESTFESMAETLRGGLSLGLSGFGFWSHDIGGFDGDTPASVYKRWIPFGLLSSHSRLHGNQSYRVPWLFDEEAVDVLRKYTRLKLDLMPYLFAAAREAHLEGTPMMRAMLLEFPEDPTCAFLDRQYMLGDSLLVAPVFNEEGNVQFYLPAGTWTEYDSGRTFQGPGWLDETHDFSSLPLWVRPGSVIPVGKSGTHAEYDYAEGVTLYIYQPQAGKKQVLIPSQQGEVQAVFDVEYHNGNLCVKLSGSAAGWRLLLVGVGEVVSVAGGIANHTDEGILLTPDGGNDISAQF